MIRLEIPDGAVLNLSVAAALPPAPAPLLPPPPAKPRLVRRALPLLALFAATGLGFQIGRWQFQPGAPAGVATAASDASIAAAPPLPAAPPPAVLASPLSPAPARPSWVAIDPAAPRPAAPTPDPFAGVARALQGAPAVLPPERPGALATSPAPAPGRNAFGLQVGPAP